MFGLVKMNFISYNPDERTSQFSGSYTLLLEEETRYGNRV